MMHAEGEKRGNEETSREGGVERGGDRGSGENVPETREERHVGGARVAIVLDGLRGVEIGSECVLKSVGEEVQLVQGKWVVELERELFLPRLHPNIDDKG